MLLEELPFFGERMAVAMGWQRSFVGTLFIAAATSTPEVAVTIGALRIGALTGAMTSAAAMSLVNTEANSSIPALGYTGTYAFANVILTVAGTLVMFA